MTDQEKKFQRAQLLVDKEDAQDDLAHLREHAYRQIERMEAAVEKLKHNATLEPSERDSTPDGDTANRLDPEHQSLPGYVDVIKLIEELKVARLKVYHLSLRNAQIQGVSATFSI